jgi:hypothetical protein
MLVYEFADRAVHFAHAKRFAQLHERSLTDRQCQQYSLIAADYVDQLVAVKEVGMPAQSAFWNDVREYSIRMIGPPGVPIPVHRTSNYWVTTDSEAEDHDLRRIVSLEIDEASSQLLPTGQYSPLALRECLGHCSCAISFALSTLATLPENWRLPTLPELDPCTSAERSSFC